MICLLYTSMKKTEYRLDEQIRQAFLSLETKWTEKEIGFQVELEEVKYTGDVYKRKGHTCGKHGCGNHSCH